MQRRGKPPTGTARLPKRPCNKCRRPFRPEGRFNHTCPSCARDNARMPRLAQRTVSAERVQRDILNTRLAEEDRQEQWD